MPETFSPSPFFPDPLPPELLARRIDPALVPYDVSSDAPPFDQPIGQDRAIEAVRFALGMNGPGYNLFCMGPEGTGKSSLVRRYLAEAAAALPVPQDWVYVYNFADSYRPRALTLPAGRARQFARDMDSLVEELRHALPAAFEADDYRQQRKALEEAVKQRQEQALDDHRARAEAKGIALVRTPMGLALAPEKDGEVLTPDDFHKLPEEEQQQLKEAMGILQHDLEEALRQAPQWERDKREKIKALDADTADRVVRLEIAERKEIYADCPQVLDYLDQAHADLKDNATLFLTDPQEQDPQDGVPPYLRKVGDEARFRRYRVNVLIDHDGATVAPVVMEDHPTQPALVGRIEHRQQLGALITDFHLIKPGALHRANGGFLMLEARKLLQNSFAYDDLKRALRKGEIRIEVPGGAWGMWSTQAMEPEPIPLQVKVVLVGEPATFYLLSEYDPDFSGLFKVVADFNTHIDRTPETVRDFTLVLAEMARQKGTLPLHRLAAAKIVEYGSRLAEDAERLTTHMGDLADLIREADHFARGARQEVISAAHVAEAIDGRRRRSGRIPEALQDEITRDIIRIETDGEAIGEINGLAVMEVGPNAFGKPSRISARVRAGRGEVIDIERQVDLGGPTHSKGVLILSSFLAHRFGTMEPLRLTATLTFEQSYGMVDGDSASSTELYALMSALSEVPIRQSLAVTGSVDQFGRVQAIGGVNEKIEGFFDLCLSRGLTGDHGVLIPASNIAHLMLRDDVVEACADGAFHIWPIHHIDEGISLLTGISAGEQEEDGQWTSGSINRRVQARLRAFAKVGALDDHGLGDEPPPPRRGVRMEEEAARRRRW
ncbi:ATP-binding protein [Novispirillum itersonii]|uniref:endopeptidase La n=1 Tax=Novispirillum itersonii TaxID=189 RepID=A0A7W9ZEP7_NOVIT|nr:ATP-binding protein [Novispirillum itersonii]MBB6209870.1 lon-related putative ATP-dependent protease [Novispirillum itersonii]